MSPQIISEGDIQNVDCWKAAVRFSNAENQHNKYNIDVPWKVV